ncbi:MAG: hypothetical protein WBF87_13915 [Mesorhizobium sp.]
MSGNTRIAVTTAGLRGSEWGAQPLPDDVRVTVQQLRTSDNASVPGFLFARGTEKTVVCLMHPRELVVASYMVPELLSGGCAVWIQGPRSVGNDLRLEHEKAVLDMAAGQNFLRNVAGFEKTVLLGISGGGPLAAMYCQQASLAPDARIRRSPGGKPTRLEEAQLPPPDGVIFVSAHPGQGIILMNAIDPSVIDEADPFATDESLSALNPANGYVEPPHSSTYAPEFLERYRAGQRERVARIDAFARSLLARKVEARKRAKAGGTREDAVLAAYAPIFEIWRTDADPRFFDLSIDPSERAFGSLWGADPLIANYGSIGFARSCTAESWLSNWSALSSNASMEKCAPAISQPVLMIEYTADNCVFPADADAIYDQIGSSQKTRHRVHGNHHGQAVSPEFPNGQKLAGEITRDWLKQLNFA